MATGTFDPSVGIEWEDKDELTLVTTLAGTDKFFIVDGKKIEKSDLRSDLGIGSLDTSMAAVEAKNTQQDARLDDLESAEIKIMLQRNFEITGENMTPSVNIPSLMDSDIIWFDGVVGKLIIDSRTAIDSGKKWVINAYATRPSISKKLKMFHGVADTVVAL